MPAGKSKKRKPARSKSRAKRTKPGAKRSFPGPAPRGGAASEAALAKVRSACLALPDTTEKIVWGAPTFRVRERLFVMFADNHHGDGRLAIWCNAAPGAQEAFVANDAENYFVPPYVGPSGWLGVRLDRGLAASEVTARIRAAHAATLAAHAARRARSPR
jgi:predicted DNA-binding protein (MmcQ/YjbR family)